MNLIDFVAASDNAQFMLPVIVVRFPTTAILYM